MSIKISFNDQAWQCPVCERFRYVKSTEHDVRVAKCCGKKFEIKTYGKEVSHYVTAIASVKEIEQ